MPYSKMPILALGPTQLPIQCVVWLFSPAIKWLGYEIDHSPPSGVKVRSEWSYTSPPLSCLHGMNRNYLYLKAVIPNLLYV